MSFMSQIVQPWYKVETLIQGRPQTCWGPGHRGVTWALSSRGLSTALVCFFVKGTSITVAQAAELLSYSWTFGSSNLTLPKLRQPERATGFTFRHYSYKESRLFGYVWQVRRKKQLYFINSTTSFGHSQYGGSTNPLHIFILCCCSLCFLVSSSQLQSLLA